MKDKSIILCYTQKEWAYRIMEYANGEVMFGFKMMLIKNKDHLTKIKITIEEVE